MLCLIASTLGLVFAEEGKVLLLPLPFIILVAVLVPCLIGLIVFFVLDCKKHKKKHIKEKPAPKIVRINDEK